MISLLLVLQSPAAAEFQSPRVRESSGVAVSRAHPDVLWTHNDSGDGPYLYATDPRGRDLGRLRVPNARAIDWEDIGLGPCPPPLRRAAASHCLYIGDTGDNLERREVVTVYAVPEPDPPTGPGDTTRATAPAAELRLRYPDGSHDVEALYVSPRDSALYLVSKGRTGAIRLYRVAPEQWTEEGVISATRVQALDLEPNPEAGRQITGAAIRPDGRVVALRTYTEVYLFYTGIGGRIFPARERPCPVPPLDRGGEAIDFVEEAVLVLTSEATMGRRGTITLLACPIGEETRDAR